MLPALKLLGKKKSIVFCSLQVLRCGGINFSGLTHPVNLAFFFFFSWAPVLLPHPIPPSSQSHQELAVSSRFFQLVHDTPPGPPFSYTRSPLLQLPEVCDGMISGGCIGRNTLFFPRGEWRQWDTETKFVFVFFGIFRLRTLSASTEEIMLNQGVFCFFFLKFN